MKNPDETAMVNMPNPIRTPQTASRSLSVMGRSFRSFTDERKCFASGRRRPTSLELWARRKATRQETCRPGKSSLPRVPPLLSWANLTVTVRRGPRFIVTFNRKLEANRRNASRSSGPRTPGSKLRSRQNARRHGLATPVENDSEVKASIECVVAILAEGGDYFVHRKRAPLSNVISTCVGSGQPVTMCF